MLDVRRQEDHYHHSRSWLETDWHFSFGEYHDPDNERFGPLRVVNHDLIDGGGGFPMHSHDNMEIITWIVSGTLVHEDSTGTKESVGRNGIQKMSAGTGISHSEYNGSDTERLHLLQIWIEPNQRDVEPSYSDDVFDEDELANQLTPVAGHPDSHVPIQQDATMYVAHLRHGENVRHELGPSRRGYLVVMTGDAAINDRSIAAGDAVRITEEESLTLEGRSDAELLFIDLP